MILAYTTVHMQFLLVLSKGKPPSGTQVPLLTRRHIVTKASEDR